MTPATSCIAMAQETFILHYDDAVLLCNSFPQIVNDSISPRTNSIDR